MPAEIEGIFIPLFSHSRQGHERGLPKRNYSQTVFVKKAVGFSDLVH
jgi:hypothetical protein